MYVPLYLTELGASVGDVGLVFTIVSTFILVLQIIGGWVSDSIGRLKAIAIGSIGGVLGYIAMLLAPSWQWMLFAVHSSSEAVALDLFPPVVATASIPRASKNLIER